MQSSLFTACVPLSSAYHGSQARTVCEVGTQTKVSREVEEYM